MVVDDEKADGILGKAHLQVGIEMDRQIKCVGIFLY